MKKFVFSLRALQDVKHTMKEEKQGEYVAALSMLDRFLHKKEEFLRERDRERRECDQKMKNGIAISELQTYDAFFDEIQKRISDASKEVVRAQKVVDQKRSELIAIHKEIKMLEKLKEEQYREYLSEIQKKETSALEDIVSFSMIQEKTQ